MPSQSLARDGLHLAALCSFAFAWQYFEPLADGPDFFIQQGATARRMSSSLRSAS